MPPHDAEHAHEAAGRIQPVIDGLIAFERHVQNQVEVLAARAEAAERELHAQAAKAEVAEKALQDARAAAARITDRATQEAQAMLEQAQVRAEDLLLESRRRERELIGALRQYLEEIERAQTTLLRIARRALSALVAETDPSASCAANTGGDHDDSSTGQEPEAHETEPQRTFRSPGFPDAAQGDPMMDHWAAVNRGGDPEVEPPYVLSASAGQHNLLDLRNQRDLERLHADDSPIMRVLSRRRGG